MPEKLKSDGIWELKLIILREGDCVKVRESWNATGAETECDGMELVLVEGFRLVPNSGDQTLGNFETVLTLLGDLCSVELPELKFFRIVNNVPELTDVEAKKEPLTGNEL